MNLSHNLSGITVGQRASDGYINATALASAHRQATGRRRDVAEWLRSKRIQKSFDSISLTAGIPVKQLYEVFEGAPENGGGTWIHPKLLDSFIEFLCKPINAKPTFLYIIGDKERNVCKIGISGDPHERLKSIQTGYPWRLDIWLELAINNPERIEKILHTRFGEYRLNGEWFDAAVFKKLDLNEFKEL